MTAKVWWPPWWTFKWSTFLNCDWAVCLPFGLKSFAHSPRHPIPFALSSAFLSKHPRTKPGLPVCLSESSMISYVSLVWMSAQIFLDFYGFFYLFHWMHLRCYWLRFLRVLLVALLSHKVSHALPSQDTASVRLSFCSSYLSEAYPGFCWSPSSLSYQP